MLVRSERQRRCARQRRLERQLGLQPREPLAAGLRRMALSQTDLVIELLGTGANGEGDNSSNSGTIGSEARPPDEKAVHETRKALKRLRTLLRLLEHELGARGYARESTALRDIAAQLSSARDAAVMLNTLDALIERHPHKLARNDGVRKLRRRLRAEHAHLQQHTLADPASHAHVLAELHAFRWRVATWALTSQSGIELIDSDLARVYRQGRKRYRRAALDRGKRIATMHEWRKRVKDLRYAAEMLERRSAGESGISRKRSDSGKAACSGKAGGSSEAGRSGKSARQLREIAKRADELSELLGEDHDLATFAQHLRAATGPSDDQSRAAWRSGRHTRRTLLKLIAKRRRKLRRRALRQGARLYREKPKRFTRRIRRLS